MSWTFERLAGPLTLTEGPAWDGTGLFFTDIGKSLVRRYDPGTGRIDIWRDGTNAANGLMFDKTGQLFACEGLGRRVVRYDKRGVTTVIADSLDGKRLNSPNDLAIDAQGRIWFTDPRYGDDRSNLELDHESVLRATPPSSDDGSWTVERMTFDTTRPNGLLLSADGAWLYVAQSSYVPTEKRELCAYPINADGTVGTYKVLHDFGAARGIDGMCLDTDGNIVASYGWELSGPGGRICVFSPDGQVLEEHPLPAPVLRPTNCSFGGPNLTTLYVTDINGYLHRTETDRKGQLWWPNQ